MVECSRKHLTMCFVSSHQWLDASPVVLKKSLAIISLLGFHEDGLWTLGLQCVHRAKKEMQC